MDFTQEKIPPLTAPSYEIIFKPRAEKDLNELPQRDRKRIAEMIDGLEEDSHPPGSCKLKDSSDLFRLKKGDYRVIYQEPDSDGTIRILKIVHRKDAYKNL